MTGTAVLDRETEQSLRQLQWAKDAETKRFDAWDKLLDQAEWQKYLKSKHLELVDYSLLPPQSMEMERAALGAMLMLDADAVTRGMTRLHWRHFYSRTHQKIFRAVADLANNRTAALVHIDTVTVCDRLARSRMLKTVDSPKGIDPLYISSCVEDCPSSANIDFYCGRVIEWSRDRHLELLGNIIRRRARTPDSDGTHLSNFILNAASAIHDHGQCDFDALLERTK